MEEIQSNQSIARNGTWDIVKNIGRMFYIVDPTETVYKDITDVPNFFIDAWPYFFLVMVLENCILWIKRKPLYRLNDGITNLSLGFMQEAGRLLFRGAESYLYIYVYENYRLIELPWDSHITWFLAALGSDFCYYWVHRAGHEVRILWAHHQVHHSSEDFNIAVGFRQSILQGWCGVLFYLPMALMVPPSHFITHYQFNMLYQFWIHTEAVNTLGPLEYIFNTPQHHRVHHGCNLYCLDKNYGGVLIIWDVLFRTFQKEKKEEQIIYGLVFTQPSFNPFYLQTFYTINVFKEMRKMKTWKHKAACLFYGPSWIPGKPRLGIEEDKMKITQREKHDVKLPLWLNVYILIHFFVVIYGFHELVYANVGMNPLMMTISIAHFLFSLTVIGMLLDVHRYAGVLEVMRCATLLILYKTNVFNTFSALHLGIELYLTVSSVLWLLFLTNCIKFVKIKHQ